MSRHPLNDIPVEPEVGRFLSGLVEASIARPVVHVAGPAEVRRSAFLTSGPADPALAPFSHRMIDSSFASYLAKPMRVHRVPAITVVGTDAVLLQDGALIRDSVRHIMYWASGSLTESFRPTEQIRLRAPVPVRPVSGKGPHFVGFNGSWRNYAHWLQEALPKLVTFAEYLSAGEQIRVVLPAFEPDSFQDQTLRLLGIDPRAVVTIANHEAVFLPDALLLDDADIWDVPPFVHQAAQFLAGRVPARPFASAPQGRSLFIHRRTGLRQLANFDEIRPLLSARGYEIFVPEELRLVDQIAIMREATRVIAEHGAGLANVLFCPPGCKVIELFNPVCVQPEFWSMASLSGLEFGFAVGEHVPMPERAQPDWNSAYRIPVATLNNILDIIG